MPHNRLPRILKQFTPIGRIIPRRPMNKHTHTHTHTHTIIFSQEGREHRSLQWACIMTLDTSPCRRVLYDHCPHCVVCDLLTAWGIFNVLHHCRRKVPGSDPGAVTELYCYYFPGRLSAVTALCLFTITSIFLKFLF